MGAGAYPRTEIRCTYWHLQVPMLPGLLHRPAVLLHLHHLDKTQGVLLRQASLIHIKQRSHLPIRAGLHVKLLLGGRHVMRGVERANLQVGASVVPAALHQVELGKEILCTSGVRGNES